MGLKQFPCCGSTHPAIAMMLALREQEGVRADAVQRIEILPHRRRLPHTDNPDPRTPLAATFSVQYAVARALLDGAVQLSHFEGCAHLDPAVRAIIDRTVARPHPDMADDAVDQFGAEIRVTLQDGRVVARRIDGQVGRGGDNPLSGEELWTTFDHCARRALPKQDILPLFDRLESLETVGDMRDVARMLARRTLPMRGGVVVSRALPVASNTLQETSWVP